MSHGSLSVTAKYPTGRTVAGICKAQLQSSARITFLIQPYWYEMRVKTTNVSDMSERGEYGSSSGAES